MGLKKTDGVVSSFYIKCFIANLGFGGPLRGHVVRFAGTLWLKWGKG